MKILVLFSLLLFPGLLLQSACTEEAASAPSLTLAPDTTVVTAIPFSSGFDYPVGAQTEPKGYYLAQQFGDNFHLGEDWNGTGGGNTDLGDPVYAVSEGQVSFAADLRGGWGKVVRIVHLTGSASAPVWVESVYAHLDTMYVKEGDIVQRRQEVGTIGTAHGQYLAHLHFELRTVSGMPIGPGYAKDTTGYTDPSAFIRRNRKLSP